MTSVVLADEDGGAEAKRADRVRHLANMGRVQLADLARRHSQILERDEHEV
jgi:hypothetical protein